MEMKKSLLFPLIFLLSSFFAIGQDRIIKGKVTASEDGLSLPGVNILIKGTTQGTVTDVDGNYVLQVPNNDAVVVFSSIGYVAQEIAVGTQTQIDVSLVINISQMEEVVVVGYGTATKKDLLGSVAKVDGESLATLKTPSFDQGLQGLATGVQVNASSGVPGAPTRVLIRGVSSVTAGTEPLWIIDGMILSGQGGGELNGFSRNAGGAPGQNPLALINPNDIESVEVLKDASATAIYGSRGANGVIIVTTKTGKQGRGSFDVSLNYGVTDVVRGPQDVGFVDGPTWLQLADESRTNAGLAEFDPNSILNNGRDPNAVLDRSQLANTNWFDEALRSGSFQDVSISTSRGTENLSYYLSTNYRRDEGFLVGNEMERISGRANIDF